ncbi:MAG: hypothetical protein K5657_08560 [Desulfovibrio sp.]|nr:hypothetical protein [Desulfovibrio sp.]
MKGIRIFAGILFLLAVCVQPVCATPSVKTGKTTAIKEGIDASVESQLKTVPSCTRFVLDDATDADLARLCSLFPGMTELKVSRGKRITDLAPLAGLSHLTRLEVLGCQAKDLSPVAGLTALTHLNIDAAMTDLLWMKDLTHLKTVAVSSKHVTSLKGLPSIPDLKVLQISHASPGDLSPIPESFPNLEELRLHYVTVPDDLSPVTHLANLKHMDFYGAKVKNFSALATCPKLKKVTYYATKGADYASLASLQQVSELMGGLSELTDMAWIAKMPNLKRFTLFAENVSDYSPLSATKLEYLKIWQMRKPVDLVPVGKIPTLKELVFWSVEDASGSKALTGLANLEKFFVGGFNKKKGAENLDLSCLAGMAKLKSLELRDTTVDHFDTVSACGLLEKVSLTNVAGVSTLAPLKGLSHLKSLFVKKGLVPENELKGFGPAVKIRQ